ncbi:MAG: tRNA (adenosine(37)-N6)-threonylcarbamoyltransferase complex dimerization subunit type 1 TsaB [Deltaproteobacteria bacterium]|jgi:tRNA threonylcarbamoyladenosine biosynthesis protein TsaB|nr:tRNA (adenosine(37)-N6)-threonylcarbamoyltransferase complex dimerization subunit type 1 TsaB [Deltaproteobacteria bacterium]
MLVLAWDTATPRLSLALTEFAANNVSRVLAQVEGGEGASHGQTLAPLVQNVLAKEGIEPRDIGLLAVGRGPGSFTGLRVGLALAKGLALASGCPVLGLPSLEVLVAGEKAEGLVAPVIDARRREIFTVIYRVEGQKITPLTEILALGPARFWPLLDEVRPLGESLTVFGPGRDLLGDFPNGVTLGSDQGPQAAILAALAYEALTHGAATSCPVVPLYGRSPEIFSSWRKPARLEV